MLVVWQLGWVEIDLGYYTTCWAAGVMAEWAEQVGRLVELENLSQHNQLPDHQHHPVDSCFVQSLSGNGVCLSHPQPTAPSPLSHELEHLLASCDWLLQLFIALCFLPS